MRNHSVAKLGLFALLALGIIGCGCGGWAGAPQAPEQGTINVYMVDSVLDEYKEINLSIQKVEIAESTSSGNERWVTLSTPNKTVNVLRLTAGVNESLAAGVPLKTGTYSKLRLVLGMDSTVRLADGSTRDLVISSALTNGVVVDADIAVSGNATSDVYVDFDAAHSIQVVTMAGGKKFMLRPVLRAVDQRLTGAISGRLTSSAGTGIAGSVVFAEYIDASGQPVIVRSTVSDSNGSYNLDLLPLGLSYHVVCMPRVGDTAYEAKASAALELTADKPLLSFDATFSANQQAGAISGTVTPIVSLEQSDSIDLLADLSVGAGLTKRLIVDTTVATLDLTETFQFSGVPVGAYFVQGSRMNVNTNGSITPLPVKVGASFGVTASSSALVSLAL